MRSKTTRESRVETACTDRMIPIFNLGGSSGILSESRDQSSSKPLSQGYLLMEMRTKELRGPACATSWLNIREKRTPSRRVSRNAFHWPVPSRKIARPRIATGGGVYSAILAFDG